VTEPVPVIRKLERAPFSASGDGKQITSGFSYWGIGPTIAWATRPSTRSPWSPG
jgi:hypothetical protein